MISLTSISGIIMCTENELNTLSVNGQQMKFLMDENFKKTSIKLKINRKF